METIASKDRQDEPKRNLAIPDISDRFSGAPPTQTEPQMKTRLNPVGRSHQDRGLLEMFPTIWRRCSRLRESKHYFIPVRNQSRVDRLTDKLCTNDAALVQELLGCHLFPKD